VKRLIASLGLLLLVSVMLQAQREQIAPKVLQDFYTKVIADYQVPGMAVVIVDSDSVLFSEGFGVLEKGSDQKVNNQTIFGIASLTKSFTTALIANLVEAGKLDFDIPLVKLYPQLQLYDNYVTSQLTLRDALAHRSGLAGFSGDLIWYGSKISDSTIIHRLQYLEPKQGFRSGFGYSNILYLLVGKVAENILETSFAQALQQQFFSPLNMKRSFADYALLPTFENIAKPHITANDSVMAIEYISWENMLPAGGIFSTTDDLGHYMQMLLNYGRYNDQVLIDSAQLQEMWHAQIPLKSSWLDRNLSAPVNFKAYGLGWTMMDYAGIKVLNHSGGLDGMVSHMLVVPELNIGAAFLTNKSTPLPTILMYDLLDRLTQNKRNWADEALAFMNKHASNEELPEEADAEEFDVQSNDFFTGRYYDSLVGEALLYTQNNTLQMKWNESTLFHGLLTQSDCLTFNLTFPPVPSLPDGKVKFHLNATGEVKGFSIDLPNPDLHFYELYFVKQN
jgi:CubicO group peptidase (beta-lactamase class C family)